MSSSDFFAYHSLRIGCVSSCPCFFLTVPSRPIVPVSNSLMEVVIGVSSQVLSPFDRLLHSLFLFTLSTLGSAHFLLFPPLLPPLKLMCHPSKPFPSTSCNPPNTHFVPNKLRASLHVLCRPIYPLIVFIHLRVV